MKFSIRWIFEHIIGDWQTLDIHHLVDTFNKVTAEIERFEKREYDVKSYTVAQVIAQNEKNVELFSPELNTTYQLNLREGIEKGQWYLLKKIPAGIRWALFSDLGGEKEGALPHVYISQEHLDGSWKTFVPEYDYILEVDNKSITHRPDLWGHRGMAREIAAYYGLSLKPLDQLLATIEVKHGQGDVNSIPHTLTLKMDQNIPCLSVAATKVFELDVRPSSIAMFFKLVPVDIKPINAVVDITNYVMFDLGSPMHAFDAQAIKNNLIEVRMAKNGEKLLLLDGEAITLTDQDIVIADEAAPLSLAGVMGGKFSGVTVHTKNVVLEAGCFDASTIRRTAAHHKKRTDASARFEKTLDASLPRLALQRYIAIAREQGIVSKISPEIIMLGNEGKSIEIELAHATIEQKLGISLAKEVIQDILTRIGFVVTCTQTNGELGYVITVPSFRASKDVKIKEDIIEEIARFYGYGTLPHVLPVHEHKPWDMNPLMRLRSAKQFLAYGLCMQEVYNYALYDEHFLRVLDFNPSQTVHVLSPVSEHWRRLVTSLMPHLLKNVQQNAPHHDQLRFFEWGRTWTYEQDGVKEKRILAGIVVNQKESIDFYAAKQEVQRLCDLLHVPVEWQRFDVLDDPWFAPYESAYLMMDGICIGRAGKIKQTQLHKVVPGDAFIFELDGEIVQNYKPHAHKYQQGSKFPEIVRDISMFVPATLTVRAIEDLVQSVDARICKVTLIDFFVGQDATERKALTVRFVLQDTTKTLTKDEADEVTHVIIDKLQSAGATIR
jgi:phenylalanyl-tRNA synthetase beta chain